MAAASEEVNVTQERKATFTSSKVCLVFQTAPKLYNLVSQNNLVSQIRKAKCVGVKVGILEAKK